MKWCLVDMSKKLDKAFKKHGNLKIIEFYGLKVKELYSANKAFCHSNSKCEYTSKSCEKSSSCDDKFAEFRDIEQSINNNVGFNKYGVANEFGKSGCIETKLNVHCEGGHKEKCLDEGIPSFNLGIEDDIYTPPKVNAGVDSYISNNSVSVGISFASVKGNVIKSHDRSEKVKILENDMISSRPKRSQTLPPVLRSPFVVRTVEIDSNLTKEENIKSNWLFILYGNPT
ncbi:unnamed protein product [Lactuca saligna]|uniref:Uncharacterized protein n=1 Tax=Lactuca saligna TaxID=75948 RepID=A0AA36DZK7_LACSI|nr:unnamed protein product [Lactuca saligna]